MKNNQRVNVLRIVCFCLWFGFSSRAFAQPIQQKQCAGHFTAQFANTANSALVTQPNALWFQGTVQLDRQLASCVNAIEIKPTNGWQHVVQGPLGNIPSSILSTQRKSVTRNPQGAFILPTLGQRQIDFWVHIPNGKESTPGHYHGDFTVSVVTPHSHITPVYASLNFAIKPFVRARIEAKNKQWVTVSGTNVRVNMGNLTQKNKRDLDIIVTSNASVKLEVRSQNDGYLVNVARSRYKIPYAVSLQGRQLEHGAPIFLNIGKNSQSRFTMGFENTAVPGAAHGRYEDKMTVSLIAY